MKKTIAFLTAGLCAGTLLAGMDNVVISFSSNGPDTYKDGTPVVDGESYALVWTPDDATFGGIKADGTAVPPSKVALTAPVAKGGKCPRVMFQIDEDYAKANFPGGSWGVYLLDTRVFATDADGIVQKDAQGRAIVTGVSGKSVKGYGEVAAIDGTSLAQVAVSTPAATGLASMANVRIRDIKFVGDNVLLYVEGADAGRFELSVGSQPGLLVPDGKDRTGTLEELIIVRPKQAGGEFFQINRK